MPDEIASITEAMPPEYQPMVWLGAMCGLRWGEVAALRVGRLDLLRSTLSVAEALSRGVKGETRFGPPKSAAGIRTLTMPAVMTSMLAEHLTRRGLTGADADELLFVTEGGHPLGYANWRRRIWLPAVEASEVDGASFHDLRRANATGLVASGVDLKTAQTRLGHSDPRLTLAVYAQATTKADEAAADALGAWFAPATADSRGLSADSTRTGQRG
jgi:integrase